MSASGYSGKTLAAKLGLAAGVSCTAFGAPRDLLETVRAESPDARIEYKPLAGVYGLRPSLFLWCFCSLDAELKRLLPALRRVLQDEGQLWISWPKKAAWKVLRVDPDTAATEDAIRAYALPLGLVDVKVCAVDETWSGLKLVVRRENRRV
ncbi:MAG: hypothetical protein K0Q91_2194 [Fibrobacteria bacterium]|jgi:hypothetical protein|nr:hypothetical protein [Fibrobacteria bacterium]